MRDEGVDRMMDQLDLAFKRRRQRRGRRLGGQYGRLPWWTLSLLAHVVALVALGHAHYGFVVEEPFTAHLVINLIPAARTPPPPEPRPPEPREDIDAPDEPGPIVPEPPTVEPGPDLPPSEDTAGSVERPAPSAPSTPSPTRVFAIKAKERGYSRSIFARRTPAGRSRAIGRRGGTTMRAERAVDAGLMWLVKVQASDGRWACKRWGGRDDYDVGMTGLALLTLMGAGHTHQKGAFKDNVARGLAWLKAHQEPDGRFVWLTFYEQGIAAMAACEAFGLTRDLRLFPMAQGAIHYICRVQPEHGGFRYDGPVTKDEGDMSITGWQILALRSAICAELDVPDEALERARVFLANTLRDDGGSAYLVRERGTAPAVTAIGMLSRQFIGGEGYDEQIRAAADNLVRHERRVRGPGNGKDRLVGDLYYTYYSALAMFQHGRDRWVFWNRLLRDPLLARQVRERRDAKGRWVRGSWDPARHHWGSAGGRVYTTAMAVMTLEVYYRFLPVYRKP